MVCNRCISTVEDIFRSNGIEPLVVSLGEVKTLQSIPSGSMEKITSALLDRGFSLIDDKKSLLLEKTKSAIIEVIHHREHFEMKINWSNYLSEKLDVDYTYLSTLFSSINGITLEQYIIKQKVEKAKEYLFYDELSVKEIAFKLGYSSIAHLSTQFKKVTGLTPSEFKNSRDDKDRTPLDKVQ